MVYMMKMEHLEKKKKQQTTKTLPYIGEYFTFLRQKNLLIPLVESLFEQ